MDFFGRYNQRSRTESIQNVYYHFGILIRTYFAFNVFLPFALVCLELIKFLLCVPLRLRIIYQFFY